MTVREINRAVLAQRHVVALYETKGGKGYTGRIIQARRHKGIVEGKVLATGHWCRIVEAWER